MSDNDKDKIYKIIFATFFVVTVLSYLFTISVDIETESEKLIIFSIFSGFFLTMTTLTGFKIFLFSDKKEK